jgi:serine/threonine-protein kinase
MIGQTISHYHIIEKLGEGSMGVVYKAQDTRLGRAVALKFLPRDLTRDPEAKRRLIQEAQAASRLDHPSICTVYEIDETPDGQVFISLAYCGGQSLADRLAQGPLAPRECVRIALDVSRGLECAHAAGVVHRDIKPANIVLTDGGEVRIVDFGLAHLAGSERLTPPQTVLGTLAYMSPEQAQGADVDQRTDLWSLGVIMYEMVAGKLPFAAQNPANLVHSILQKKPPRWDEVALDTPPELTNIVYRCLTKNPARRYQEAGEVRAALETVVQGMSTSSPPTVRISPFWRLLGQSRHRLSLLPILLAALVVLGGSALVIMRLVNPGPDRRDGLVLLPPALVGGAPSDQPLADGLVIHLTDVLMSRELPQEGAWVVPAAAIRHRAVVGIEDARGRLGVTRALASTLHLQGETLRLVLIRHEVDPRGWQRLIGTPPSRDVVGSFNDLVAWQAEVQQTLMDLTDWRGRSAERNVVAPCGTAMPHALVHYLRGLGLLDPYVGEADTEGAINAFQRAVAADSTFAEAYGELARALWRQHQEGSVHRLDEALATCEHALALAPELGAAHYLRGHLLVALGQSEEAAASFRRYLEIVPDHALALRDLADVELALGNIAEAGAVLQQAIQRRPNYVGALNDFGVFLVGRGRFDEAIESFRSVIALAPAHLHGLSNLGSVYYHLDLWDEAEAMFLRCLALEPDAITYQNLGTMYFYDRRYLEAARMYEKSIELGPRDYLAYGWAAECYYWSGTDRAGAEEHYRRAAALADSVLGLYPDDARVQADLASYLVLNGAGERARALLAQAADPDPHDADVYFAMAACYENLGEREAALRDVERALREGYPLSLLERYPGMDRLRTDHRYEELLARVMGDGE